MLHPMDVFIVFISVAMTILMVVIKIGSWSVRPVVEKIALNLLKKDMREESLRSKRLKAAWNKNFLIKLLEN